MAQTVARSALHFIIPCIVRMLPYTSWRNHGVGITEREEGKGGTKTRLIAAVLSAEKARLKTFVSEGEVSWLPLRLA